MIISDIPENHGLSSKVLQHFFAKIDELNLAVNSFMLLQDGKCSAQFWREPYRKDTVQLLFSLSKSFTSIGVGIAWDNGYLDMQDQVISYFPDKLPKSISANLEKMTIHHLLSMNTGHQENIYGKMAGEDDWVKTFLSLEVLHEPGSHYLYNTHATYMLSAIVERATGRSLNDFLTSRLFEPLEIPKPSWETCPMGITAGGMGLSLHTESIAKFGQMLLNKGMYNGHRIVSEKFIELATKEQSDNRKNTEKIDWAQGYGYQFHLCRRGAYRGDGAFGQLCFVAPNENIVIVATSSLTSMKELQTLLDLIYETIFDNLEGDGLQHRGEDPILEQQISSMRSLISNQQLMNDEMPNLNNLTFDMSENPHQLTRLHFDAEGEQLEIKFCYEDSVHDQIIPFHMNHSVNSYALFIKDLSYQGQEVVTYASWLDKDTLKLTLLYIETPYVVTYILRFEDGYLHLHFKQNVSLSQAKEYAVVGKQALSMI